MRKVTTAGCGSLLDFFRNKVFQPIITLCDRYRGQKSQGKRQMETNIHSVFPRGNLIPEKVCSGSSKLCPIEKGVDEETRIACYSPTSSSRLRGSPHDPAVIAGLSCHGGWAEAVHRVPVELQPCNGGFACLSDGRPALCSSSWPPWSAALSSA